MAGTRARRSALIMCAFSWLTACKSEAVAIEECREIEHTRCEASVPCGTVDADDVDECKRIYDDQCLHGIAGPEAPSANQQDACVTLIEEAGERARASEPGKRAFETACSVVGEPWESKECEFLNPGEGGASGEDESEEEK